MTSWMGTLPRSRRLQMPLGAGILLALVLVVLLVPSVTASGTVSSRGSLSAPSAQSFQVGVLKLTDDSTLQYLKLGHVLSTLTDAALAGRSTGYQRTYQLSLTTALVVPLVSVTLVTSPLTVLGQPGQLPGGQDALPPFASWSFTILAQGQNDTANWTANAGTGQLYRSVPWQSGQFVITGRTTPVLSISVLPTLVGGQSAPASGFVANSIFSPSSGTANDPAFPGLAAATHPGIVRIGITSIGVSITWNVTNHSVSYKWVGFDRMVNFSESMGANIMLSLPAGSWGDGNTLPVGMPLDPTMPVTFYGTTGYFPTTVAYAKYVGALAQHVQSTKARVVYWNIGNEVPRVNVSEVASFIKVFNTALTAIHRYLPGARVGTDVLLDPKYLPQFAKGAPTTGFLSFHMYAVAGMCINNGVYCPPTGGNNGVPDPNLVDRSTEFGTMLAWEPPLSARSDWYNATGHWLPVIDSESGLNHEGGTLATASGTDPRIETLFGAQWLAGLYIDGTQEGVKGIVYYTLAGPETLNVTPTSAAGGWGFEMIRENASGPAILYAPYWAATMWGKAVPSQSPALITTGSVAALAEAQAYRTHAGVSVVAVNHVNATVKFTVSFPGASLSPSNLSLLDHRSYSETWNVATHQEVLGKSGVLSRVRTSNPVTFILQGYGVAVLTEVPSGTHAPARSVPALGALFDPSALCSAANTTHGSDATAPAGVAAPAFLEAARTPWTEGRVVAASRPSLAS
ncbi:MAG: hypothetical protein ACHQ16_01635 [Candidatus Lutacidiplasmatales archaeon]